MRDTTEIQLEPIDPGRLAPIIGNDRVERLRSTAAAVRGVIEGRGVVNVNSTASGGGVAEMLYTLLGYSRGLDIDARWIVITGDPAFFAVTKRVHNGLYGGAGDRGNLGEPERAAYESALRENAESIAGRVRPDDVLVLHDPQTAGLIPLLRGDVACIVWRCHVGLDTPSEWSERAWAFLQPYVEQADGLVFSRREFAPSWVDESRLAVIPPSIDPFTPKNEELPREVVKAILHESGLLGVDGARPVPSGLAIEEVELTRDGVLPDLTTPLVTQVSRWDRMKDMPGVMQAFAEHVDPALGAHLVLAGPSVIGVTDDPEGAEVLADVQGHWEGLSAEIRPRVHLACIGMGDIAANARVVNALQSQAAVVVQKSLAEGFGLTVSEALWKRRPVVASAVGGIVDQITHGVEGLLVEPLDYRGAGEAMQALLEDESRRVRMGEDGRRRVVDEFLADRHLAQYAAVLAPLLGENG